MRNVFHNLGGAPIGNFRQLINSFVFFFGLYEYEGLFSDPSEWRLLKRQTSTHVNYDFVFILFLRNWGQFHQKINIDRKVAWLSINFRNTGTNTKLSPFSEKVKKHVVIDYSGAYESHFRITKCTQCDDNYMQTTLNFLIFQANKMTFRNRYQAVIYYFM